MNLGPLVGGKLHGMPPKCLENTIRYGLDGLHLKEPVIVEHLSIQPLG